MNGSTRTRRGLRRVLGLSLGGAMILAMVPGAASAQTPPYNRGTDEVCDFDPDSSFPDVGPPNVHAHNIECMADYGLTEGLNEPGNPYGPQLEITRAQMASFIARFVEDATDTTLAVGDTNRFDDSDTFVSPHRTNINKLAEADIVSGFPDGNYRPYISVNRQQMATFIRNAISYIHNGDVTPYSAPPEYVGGPIFQDEPFVFAHATNIRSLAGVGIVQGNRAGYYLPTNPVLRDQMASFVMRAYDYVESDEFPGPGGTDPDPDPDPDPEPEGPTVDTAFVAFAADSPNVAVGDIWELEFSDAVDTFVVADADTGVTFTVSDGDDDEYVVQCLVDADDPAGGVDDGNLAAACDLEDDFTLTITLLDAPDGDVEYPLTLVDTTLMAEDDDRPFDLDPDWSDVELEINAETNTPT